MQGGFVDREVQQVPEEAGLAGRHDDHIQGLDDFTQLAETYLLDDPTLVNDFPDVDGDAFEASLGKTGEDGIDRRAAGLDPFLWDPTSQNFRGPSLDGWHGGDARQLQNKAAAEARDSNDWEQTKDKRGKNLRLSKSDSPQSGHLSATSTPVQSGRPKGLKPMVENAVDASHRPESPFIPRLGPQDQAQLFDAEKHPHLPQSFSRLLNGSMSMNNLDPMEAYEWPQGAYPAYANTPYPRSVFSSQTHGPPIRKIGSWAGGEYPEHGWNQMRVSRSGALPYRHSEQPLENIMEFAPPSERGCQSTGDMLAMQSPMPRHMRSRAGSSVDDISNISGHKVGMPMMTNPLPPNTPSEAFAAERKRKRPLDVMFAPAGSVVHQDQGHHSQQGISPMPAPYVTSNGSRLMHEDLIRTLKGQIEGVDSQTKSILKDTLYRISRHTNVLNGAVEESRPRQSNRSQSLDKMVANFLYNRFENPENRQRGSPYVMTSSGGYGNRGGRVSSLESIKTTLAP